MQVKIYIYFVLSPVVDKIKGFVGFEPLFESYQYSTVGYFESYSCNNAQVILLKLWKLLAYLKY